jgi:hypothetical protein
MPSARGRYREVDPGYFAFELDAFISAANWTLGDRRPWR